MVFKSGILRTGMSSSLERCQNFEKTIVMAIPVFAVLGHEKYCCVHSVHHVHYFDDVANWRPSCAVKAPVKPSPATKSGAATSDVILILAVIVSNPMYACLLRIRVLRCYGKIPCARMFSFMEWEQNICMLVPISPR